MLAEEIHIFDGGQIIEAGGIDEVYARPQHITTMRLLGYPNANVLMGRLFPNGDLPVCKTDLFDFHSHLDEVDLSEDDVYVAIRPQDIRINPETIDNLILQEAEITLVEDLGGELLVYLETQNIVLEAIVQHNGASGLVEGDALIGISPSNIMIYAMQNALHIGKGVA
jgi:ABC-type sugar transport system ATPase subunit